MSRTAYELARYEQFPNLDERGNELSAEQMVIRHHPERYGDIAYRIDLAELFSERLGKRGCECDVDYCCENHRKAGDLADRAVRLFRVWRRMGPFETWWSAQPIHRRPETRCVLGPGSKAFLDRVAGDGCHA